MLEVINLLFIFLDHFKMLTADLSNAIFTFEFLDLYKIYNNLLVQKYWTSSPLNQTSVV